MDMGGRTCLQEGCLARLTTLSPHTSLDITQLTIKPTSQQKTFSYTPPSPSPSPHPKPTLSILHLHLPPPSILPHNNPILINHNPRSPTSQSPLITPPRRPPTPQPPKTVPAQKLRPSHEVLPPLLDGQVDGPVRGLQRLDEGRAAGGRVGVEVG